ncbi:MAG TPA: hypothetical protein VJY62_22675, partial [Bacteroidia bacterium]|nr:hypothetical protein [Bacteroidia bacterium]
MVNKFYFKKTVKFFALIVFGIFISCNLLAQSKGYVEVIGKVQQHGKALEGASVKVYKGNEPIDDILTNNAGRIILNLDFNYVYTLVFSKKGAITKSIVFDTKIPDEYKDVFFSNQPFRIDLLSIPDDSIQINIPDKPVAKYAFNPSIDDFDFDQKYSSARKDEFEVLKKDIEAARAKARQDSIADARAQASALSRAAVLEKARQDSIKRAQALADKLEAQEKARLAALEKSQRDSIAKAQADS